MEYPITRANERPFNFHKTSSKQAYVRWNVRSTPNETWPCYPAAEKMTQALSEEGWGGSVDQDKYIVGAIAYRDLRKYERAYPEPLNTQRRQYIRSYQDKLALSPGLQRGQQR